MGQGGLIFCELDSVKKEYPDYQRAFADLEAKAVLSCTDKWFPKKSPAEAFGLSTPNEDQFGETSILPALFDPNPAVYGGAPFGGAKVGAFTIPPRDFRQYFSTKGHQVILQGSQPGETITKGFQIGWMGLMFIGKQMLITELRWQTSDSKKVRVNIEALHSYNKPALIFEEGHLLKEEQAFHLHGYVEEAYYQRVIPIGAAYFKVIDKVLGNPGDAI